MAEEASDGSKPSGVWGCIISWHFPVISHIYLCPTIIQEILHGIVREKQFNEIKEYILEFNILNDDAIQLAVSAAGLYRALRKKGVTK